MKAVLICMAISLTGCATSASKKSEAGGEVKLLKAKVTELEDRVRDLERSKRRARR